MPRDIDKSIYELLNKSSKPFSVESESKALSTLFGELEEEEAQNLEYFCLDPTIDPAFQHAYSLVGKAAIALFPTATISSRVVVQDTLLGVVPEWLRLAKGTWLRVSSLVEQAKSVGIDHGQLMLGIRDGITWLSKNKSLLAWLKAASAFEYYDNPPLLFRFEEGRLEAHFKHACTLGEPWTSRYGTPSTIHDLSMDANSILSLQSQMRDDDYSLMPVIVSPDVSGTILAINVNIVGDGAIATSCASYSIGFIRIVNDLMGLYSLLGTNSTNILLDLDHLDSANLDPPNTLYVVSFQDNNIASPFISFGRRSDSKWTWEDSEPLLITLLHLDDVSLHEI